MARYLITGAAGFVGSSLSEELVRSGHEVRGVDDLSCGDLTNLAGLLAHMEFRQMDINDTVKLRDFCRGVDFILHEAAIASVPRSIADPVRSHKANINGTLSVLLAARDAGVGRVIYAASSSAYGDQPTQPKRETMVPSPLSPYAVQKLAGEQYVRSFWQVYGLPGVCLRYFNVFGPKQSADSPYSGVIARFTSDMLQAKQPTIFGDGSQSRDFTFIANVISANLLACTAESSNVVGEVFNIGTGRSHTINSLCNQLASLLKWSGGTKYVAARNGDIEHSEADIDKARQAFGYMPLVAFDEGLRITTEWYLAHKSHSLELHALRQTPNKHANAAA